jgi:hypothetical protein
VDEVNGGSAAMKADLADLERLKVRRLGGALVATAMLGPALIPLMRTGFLWLSLIPPVLWAFFTGLLWWRYVRISGEAARLRLEINRSESSSTSVSATEECVQDEGAVRHREGWS